MLCEASSRATCAVRRITSVGPLTADSVVGEPMQEVVTVPVLAYILMIHTLLQDTERFQRDAALQQRKAEREAVKEAERVAKEEAKLKVVQERAAKREAQEAEKEAKRQARAALKGLSRAYAAYLYLNPTWKPLPNPDPTLTGGTNNASCCTACQDPALCSWQ